MWTDIPIINKWEDVFDEGVTKGFCNWQMYGPRKPGHQAYLIKNHYTLSYDGNDWSVEENDMNKFNTKKNLRNQHFIVYWLICCHRLMLSYG